MRTNLTIAAATLNQTPIDWENNTKNILEAIRLANTEEVDILCLPELCVTGYGCEDLFFSKDLQKRALNITLELAKSSGELAFPVGLPLLFNNTLYNVSCLCHQGKVIGFTPKHHLANYEIHYERRWFKEWEVGRCETILIDNTEYLIGDYIFDVKGIKVGFEMCEDAWVEKRFANYLKSLQVDVILNPSASHFAFNKWKQREEIVKIGSKEFAPIYVYANLLGNEAGRAIYDGTTLIAHNGEIVTQGKRFSYQNVEMVFNRFSLSESGFQPLCIGRKLQEATSSAIKHTEFARVIALGLFDYMRKSHSAGFVVSLSGGADSSATAILASFAIRLAWKELGTEPFYNKLSYIEGITEYKAEDELIKKLLTCVYQSTKNSSEITHHAAAKLACAISANFIYLDVDSIVANYTTIIEKSGVVKNSKLTWAESDIPLQNIQARVRGPSVWFIANLKNALLLATSNRSEAAVGYTTMDGDTCGGLSPIAGIDKAYLREWLRWLENNQLPEELATLTPIPVLSLVNEQQPTAELRPPSEHQTDEQDLMPYELLDKIERLFVRDKKSPLEVFEELKKETLSYSDKDLHRYIEKFYTQLCRNQWKRERYAPSFHLDDENLDPKTWFRFPILSGGYLKELEELLK